ncbi:hypothetical protein CLV78_102227 [Aliiruegeria haliotis]|uniref:Sulfotransferase family protein n=1 Tax=Aliiruegeria haliotis TaxID=1280846 RepID=A0A2T0RV74_9RHOB|nr:hypothetical protein [Aliiruegeria haliotis]PRY25050.1 hypothetical protein CLV78_102227 [Aliiruegeria haliotis]
MHVTLHLGAHRTGVATLQRFLLANRRDLHANRIAAWVSPELRAGMISGLVRRPEAVSLKDERTGRRSVGLLRLRQDRLEKQGRARLIVSEPYMIGTPGTCLRSGRLYPWAGERLLQFQHAFADRCDRILISIRSYDRFWTSLLASRLAEGYRFPDAAALDRLVTQPLRWRHLIAEVAHVFPRARLFLAAQEAFCALPERQFAALSGITFLPGQVSRMAEARGWHRRSPTADRMRALLRDRGQEAPVRADGSGRWYPFDELQRTALLAQYSEDLAWLRGGAGGLATLIEHADTPQPIRSDSNWRISPR